MVKINSLINILNKNNSDFLPEFRQCIKRIFILLTIKKKLNILLL